MFTADYTKASHFILDQLNWAKLSFSYLSQKHTGTPTIPSLPSGDPYDQFVFNELKKGAVTGNMLHSIFETIDYSDPTTWKPVVDQVLLRYAVGDKEDFSKKIIQFLEVVLSTDIQFPGGISYPLSAVRMEDRLAELEFDFPLGNFHTDKLNALSDLGIPVRVRGIGDLEGIMNGKIDLVFEWQGQFYILDWKSNFLGYRAEDYGPDSIETSMQENNYHLQYLIYTVALCKYLRLRKPDFDYDRDFGGGAYVFLRGVRNGKNTGFYITKPEKKLVELIQDILHGNVNA